MAGLISTTGLITGIPIEDTVNKLMTIAARPRDLLKSRNDTLQSEQLAISKLSSLVLAFKFEADKLGKASLFQSKAATSSDTEILDVALATNGQPPSGSYKFRVLQTASSQQVLSNSLASLDDLSTNGKLSFGFGGFVDTGLKLADLNGGAGVSAGWLRITDRAGNAANIDLRTAKTIDDVLRAINENTAIDVTAATNGDRITLADQSGGTGNLRVQEVGTGTTAAGLGLASVNVAANSATGNDIVTLGSNTTLAFLNDGNGVELLAGNDLAVSFRDGTSVDIDLEDAATIGDVLAKLNAASPTKLAAAISADGNRLELTDLTSGGNTFWVANVGAGTAATGLGLTVDASGGTIAGRRLVAGLRDTLVGSLRGGQGVGALGTISITNRNNVASAVDLSSAETLGEIVAEINDQATGVTAAINAARNGIVLTDTTGATTSNLIVADGDATNTATDLGLTTNAAAVTKNSGSLARQQIGRATLLSSLNRGEGVSIRDFSVTDSAGHTGVVDMNQLDNEAQTIGDVLDRINALADVEVEARLNDTGDGIILIDQAGGSGKLTVAEYGGGTAAADLRILGASVATEINGQTFEAIDGTTRYTVDLATLGDPGSNIALSSLNNGEGIQLGAFQITDSNGQTAAVVLSASAGTFETVADVLAAINATNIGVEARINSSGSGILLVDTAGGAGTLEVEELAGGSTAADLGLDAAVKTIEVDSVMRQTIDGLGTFLQPPEGALGALVSRINTLGAGVTASSVYDGTSYRLSLSDDETGTGRELLVDGSEINLDFSEFAAARDAVIEFGGTQLGAGIAVASRSNTFSDVVTGLKLTAVKPSDETVTVNVSPSATAVVDTVQDFVDAYNSIRANLDEVTDFDPDALTTGILFGSSAALRVEADLSYLISGRFYGLGKFASLEAIGVTFDAKGKLALNKTELQQAFESDPDALSDFFASDDVGVAAKLSDVIDRLTGDDSVLEARTDTLNATIESNTERLEDMNVLLEKQRERLLKQFTLLEATVAKLQSSLSALNSLQVIPPLSSSSK